MIKRLVKKKKIKLIIISESKPKKYIKKKINLQKKGKIHDCKIIIFMLLIYTYLKENLKSKNSKLVVKIHIKYK